MYCIINGYWKNDKTEFSGLLVRAYDDTPSDSDKFTDDDIFYYGLCEEQIVSLIEDGENTFLQFVILSYEKA